MIRTRARRTAATRDLPELRKRCCDDRRVLQSLRSRKPARTSAGRTKRSPVHSGGRGAWLRADDRERRGFHPRARGSQLRPARSGSDARGALRALDPLDLRDGRGRDSSCVALSGRAPAALVQLDTFILIRSGVRDARRFGALRCDGFAPGYLFGRRQVASMIRAGARRTARTRDLPELRKRCCCDRRVLQSLRSRGPARCCSCAPGWPHGLPVRFGRGRARVRAGDPEPRDFSRLCTPVRRLRSAKNRCGPRGALCGRRSVDLRDGVGRGSAGVGHSGRAPEALAAPQTPGRLRRGVRDVGWHGVM